MPSLRYEQENIRESELLVIEQSVLLEVIGEGEQGVRGFRSSGRKVVHPGARECASPQLHVGVQAYLGRLRLSWHGTTSVSELTRSVW
jgi:hypothetical protein